MKIYYLSSVKSADPTIETGQYSEQDKFEADLARSFADVGVNILKEYQYLDDSEDPEYVKHRAYVLLSALKQDDLLIIRAPFDYNSSIYLNYIIDRGHQFFRTKVAAIVTDLFSTKGQPTDLFHGRTVAEWAKIESQLLNQLDAVIAPTEELAAFMRLQLNYRGPITIQGPWSYLSGTSKQIQETNRQTVALIAGEAAHAQRNEVAKVFTPGIGAVDYLTLQELVGASFGLIQHTAAIQANEADSVSLTIPAVLGLYANASMPVIVLKGTYLAEYVNHHQIGIVVEQLTDVQTVVNRVSDLEFTRYGQNIAALAELIGTGIFQKRALFKMIGTIYDR